MSISDDASSSRLGVMIMISCLLHLIVLVAGGSWKVYSPPRLTFGPVYEVKLVDHLPTSEMTYAPSLEGVSINKRPTLSVKREEAPIPISRLKTGRGSQDEVKRALEELQKRVATQGTTSRPSGASSGPAAEGVMDAYLRTVWDRIRSGWVLPPGINTTDPWEAVVHVQVQKNGHVSNVTLARSSGNAYFDRSVIRAIQKADPLPPLPRELGDDHLEMGIRFHSQEAIR